MPKLSAKRKTTNAKRLRVFFLAILFAFSLITSHLFTLSAAEGSLANAQQTPLDSAKANYTTSLSQFQDSYNAYTSAKAAYKSFGTATAKSEAFTKTQTYLISVDNLLLSYCRLVGEYGNQTRWQSSDFDKSTSDQVLADQVTYVKAHQQKLQDTKTLEELPPLAQELKNQLEKSTQPKINKIIVTYDIAQTQYVLNQFKNLSDYLNSIVNTKINSQNNTLFLNWQSEIGDIRDKTGTDLNLTKTAYGKIREDSSNSFQIKHTVELLAGAKTNLKRSKALFGEMLKIL